MEQVEQCVIEQPARAPLSMDPNWQKLGERQRDSLYSSFYLKNLTDFLKSDYGRLKIKDFYCQFKARKIIEKR